MDPVLPCSVGTLVVWHLSKARKMKIVIDTNVRTHPQAENFAVRVIRENNACAELLSAAKVTGVQSSKFV